MDKINNFGQFVDEYNKNYQTFKKMRIKFLVKEVKKLASKYNLNYDFTNVNDYRIDVYNEFCIRTGTDNILELSKQNKKRYLKYKLSLKDNNKIKNTGKHTWSVLITKKLYFEAQVKADDRDEALVKSELNMFIKEDEPFNNTSSVSYIRQFDSLVVDKLTKTQQQKYDKVKQKLMSYE